MTTDLRHCVALISPRRSGALDEDAFSLHLRRMTGAGLDGLLIGGSTGRGDQLRSEELARLLELARRDAPTLHRMAGFGAQALRSDELLRRIEGQAHAAESFLVCAPEDDHAAPAFFERVVRESPVPVFVYHPPARRARPLPGSVIVELGQIEGLAGVKDSSGLDDLVAHWREARPGFRLLLGSIRLYARRSADVDGAILAYLNHRPEIASTIEARGEAALTAVDEELKRIKAEGLDGLLTLMREASLPT